MGADVVTVSTDTEFVHLAWQRHEKELENVKFQMGADPTGNTGRLLGVYDDGSGLTLRGTFIINPEGVLMNSEVNFYNMGRNIDELMRKFKANRRRLPGQVEGRRRQDAASGPRDGRSRARSAERLVLAAARPEERHVRLARAWRS
jgi:hypothetical protein